MPALDIQDAEIVDGFGNVPHTDSQAKVVQLDMILKAVHFPIRRNLPY